MTDDHNFAHSVLHKRSDPAAQRIADLAKGARSPGKTMLIEDAEPLLNALRADLEFLGVYILDTIEPPAHIIEHCERLGITPTIMDASLARALFKSDKRPDVFGIAKAPRPTRVKDFLATNGDILILDGVRIVGNIGAVVRSAFAFGASGVVVVNSDLTSITDRRLLRASRGYVFSLPVALMNWAQVDALVSECHVDIATLDMAGKRTLTDISSQPERMAFIVGSETEGISLEAKERDPDMVSIPIHRDAESLNVSVAAAVLLHARSPRNLATLPVIST